MRLNRRDFLKISIGTAGLVLLNSPKKASAQDSPNKSVKAVLVDTTRCVGCWWCYATCKHEHNLPEIIELNLENPPELNSDVWTTLSTRKNGSGWLFAKRQCMHCEHPACVEACIVGALEKKPDGPVTYDERKCIGCRYCQVACPFGVPNFEWEDPTPWIRKCDFCADRLAQGLEPACVSACPNSALKFGERGELIAEAHRQIAAKPEKYVDHVYGESEIGGTSWLYLSSVPFEELEFPALDSEPVTVNAVRAMGAVPPVLLGVAAVMTGIYWFTKRRQKIDQIETGRRKSGKD